MPRPNYAHSYKKPFVSSWKKSSHNSYQIWIVDILIIIQLLIPIFPNLEKLQKEEGEIGRQQINRYTRYLTFIWAVILSTGIAFILIKPVTFGWSFFNGLEIIIALTVGSILYPRPSF